MIRASAIVGQRPPCRRRSSRSAAASRAWWPAGQVIGLAAEVRLVPVEYPGEAEPGRRTGREQVAAAQVAVHERVTGRITVLTAASLAAASRQPVSGISGKSTRPTSSANTLKWPSACGTASLPRPAGCGRRPGPGSCPRRPCGSAGRSPSGRITMPFAVCAGHQQHLAGARHGDAAGVEGVSILGRGLDQFLDLPLAHHAAAPPVDRRRGGVVGAAHRLQCRQPPQPVTVPPRRQRQRRIHRIDVDLARPPSWMPLAKR